jgi:molybdopterin-guanine dinucleotide biosynthesis protein A
MNLSEGVVGILLAGGKSSRMGGGDKCLLPMAGRPLLAYVIERLRPQVSDIVINANGDLSRFSAFGLPLIPDRLGDQAGPLAGVHAGIEWALANRPASRFVITAATDTPFFPADLVSRFCSAIKDDVPRLLVARSAGGTHQIFGLWPISLAPKLEESLNRGMRKVGDWVRRQQAEEVSFPPTEIDGRKIDPFFNINRPDDLAEAEAFLQGILS